MHFRTLVVEKEEEVVRASPPPTTTLKEPPGRRETATSSSSMMILMTDPSSSSSRSGTRAGNLSTDGLTRSTTTPNNYNSTESTRQSRLRVSTVDVGQQQDSVIANDDDGSFHEKGDGVDDANFDNKDNDQNNEHRRVASGRIRRRQLGDGEPAAGSSSEEPSALSQQSYPQHHLHHPCAPPAADTTPLVSNRRLRKSPNPSMRLPSTALNDLGNILQRTPTVNQQKQGGKGNCQQTPSSVESSADESMSKKRVSAFSCPQYLKDEDQSPRSFSSSRASSTYPKPPLEGVAPSSNGRLEREDKKRSCSLSQSSTTNDIVRRHYYRIVYRGVVALLASPHRKASRSGYYLGYGDVFATTSSSLTGGGVGRNNNGVDGSANDVVHDNTVGHLDGPANGDYDHHDKDNRTVLRVDAVLTGVYAVDANATMDDDDNTSADANKDLFPVSVGSHTTRRPYQTDDHYERQQQGSDEVDQNDRLGFLFTHRKDVVIAEPLLGPPVCETGSFLYKVVSSTPIPILTGPCLDAPKTKALVLPGTVHEISRRVTSAVGVDDVGKGIWFMRLSHRRGWIADRKPIIHNKIGKMTTLNTAQQATTRTTTKTMLSSPVLREVTNDIPTNRSSVEADSSTVTTNSTVTTSSSGAPGAGSCSSFCREGGARSLLLGGTTVLQGQSPRRRHRPPRRRIDIATGGSDVLDKNLPRQIIGGTSTTTLLPNRPSSVVSEAASSSAAADRLMTPSSNVSLLSDDSYLEQFANLRQQQHHHQQKAGGSDVPASPDVSHASCIKSVGSNVSSSNANGASTSFFFLMRVTAPRGLKILDAPHFQVNNLIHGKPASSHVEANLGGMPLPSSKAHHHHSIFQTMSGRLSTTGSTISRTTSNPAIFDANSRTRVLPRGSLFEASRRMERTGTFISRGAAGLIKLSDQSGWAIVPTPEELEHQHRAYQGGIAASEGENIRAYEEIGNALIDVDDATSYFGHQPQRGGGSTTSSWLRVNARLGLPIACPPPPPLALGGGALVGSSTIDDDTTSPTSSKGSSTISSRANNRYSATGAALSSNGSDMSSSLGGSTFLDAMFRTPKKKTRGEGGGDNGGTMMEPLGRPPMNVDKQIQLSNTVPCGMCVEVERFVDSSHTEQHHHQAATHEYVRLRGGQGWLPLKIGGRPVALFVPRPEVRFGSFWFRVQSVRGIKVRLGPSKKAPSIKSEDGDHFRFECGEFLRASEVMTVFSEDDAGKSGAPVECFAKLYRNRHIRLHRCDEEYRQISSLTTQSEWVQVHGREELYLEECATDPRIERHKQGWRYSVIHKDGVPVRKGPSFAAEKTGLVLPAVVKAGGGGNEDGVVIINERVSPAGEKITWLRIKNGSGWIHDVADNGDRMVTIHSLRQRVQQQQSTAAGEGTTTTAITARPQKKKQPPLAEGHEAAYNTIIARLFHNSSSSNDNRGSSGGGGVADVSCGGTIAAATTALS